MININNKSWDQLSFSDIEAFLTDGEENTFFEFKEDRETNEKLTKEIVAFSNTYGGYVLLGVNNDKSISGCSAWNEQRIHTLIHDSVLPTPIFDVKKLTREDGITIYVIKVEEGPLPPYVTNNGQIYERLSSGAFPIKDSGRLTMFYNKRNDAINIIRNKIEMPELTVSNPFPNNFCGYVDMGFSLTCSEETVLQKHFYDYDFTLVVEHLRKEGYDQFSISQVGGAYQISLGGLSLKDESGNEYLINAGLNNYMEIMWDGSVRSRYSLYANVGTPIVPIHSLIVISGVFREIYKIIFEQDLRDSFIYAQKYEKLTVLKQFTPVFGVYKDLDKKEDDYQLMSDTHTNKYGGNSIIIGNRIPWNGYNVIDRRWLNEQGKDFSVDSLLHELFDVKYQALGFIDFSPLKTIRENYNSVME
mgnify:CR=1 FL=1